MRIPKTGPVVLKTSNGGTVELWYNRDIRFWVLQVKDVDGNQTGPAYGGEAEYHTDRATAVEEMLAFTK